MMVVGMKVCISLFLLLSLWLIFTGASTPHHTDTGEEDSFIGFHQVPGTGGPVQRYFSPSNNLADESRPQSTAFAGGLEGLREALTTARAAGLRTRGLGSGWSISDAPYDPETMVRSQDLDYLLIGTSSLTSHVTAAYAASNNVNALTFCQPGVTVKEWNQALFMAGLSTSTSGTSDGQRVVGAVSTGTHGSRLAFGGMAEMVRGVHVVLPGPGGTTRDVYVQRASDPVMEATFVSDFLGGGTLVNDDDVFAAVTVGVGSIGLIHGVLLQTERLYQLRSHVKLMDFSDVRNFATTLENVASLGIGGITELPFSVDIQINAFKKKKNAYVKLMEQVPLSDQEIQAAIASATKRESALSPGEPLFPPVYEDLHEVSGREYDRLAGSVFATVINVLAPLKRLVYGIVISGILDKANKPNSQDGPFLDFPLAFFTEGEGAGVNSSAEMAVGVPLGRLGEALDIILGILNKRPVPTALGIRYLPASDMLWALNQYSPYTASITMPSMQDNFLFRDTSEVFGDMFDALEAAGIPTTCHMGKPCPGHDRWTTSTVNYGDTMTRWQQFREAHFQNEADDARMFCSPLTSTYGLCEL